MAGMERFTQRARRVLSLAHQEAERMHQNAISTEHVLLGLIEEEGGIAGRVLRDLGLETERVREMVERLGGSGTFQGNKVDLSSGVQQVLEFAIDEARRMGHHYIGTEHLLLGLVRSSEGLSPDVLRKLGVTPEQIRRQTRRVLQESSTQPGEPAQREKKGDPSADKDKEKGKEKGGKTPLVDQLAVDLTTLAEEGKLDPVIGRQMEIERVIQILARRTKNNPALIGEPGVGKTAIVEGLAQRILEGDVPAPLLDKRVLQLDVGLLVAGTMYRGQFEERLKKVIDEIESTDTVLFIGELHMLVGAGAAGSSVDAATSSNRRSRAANCRSSARPRWRNTASTSNPTPRSNGASSPSAWKSPPSSRPSKSSRASARPTKSTTAWSSPMKPWMPRRTFRRATSPSASCPTRPST